MQPSPQELLDLCRAQFSDSIEQANVWRDELTLEIKNSDIHKVCLQLRDGLEFQFDLFIDACGVDYSEYGKTEWETSSASRTGFQRGVEAGDMKQVVPWDKPRFAVVYHLLSTVQNKRLRLRVFVDEKKPMVDSVTDVWPAANWFEREAFDLFGILFRGHPDLRRLLTDYGFIGHPFRKDFPLSGHVEVRYDAEQERVIYEPVDIEPRVLVPKVIRQDNRYETTEE